MNASGYVGHVTTRVVTIQCCLGLELAYGQLVVMHTYVLVSIAIVTLPCFYDEHAQQARRRCAGFISVVIVYSGGGGLTPYLS